MSTTSTPTAEVWDCTHTEYHADGMNSISRSELDLFIESEEKYAAKFIYKNLPEKTSKALDLGVVFHDLVLGFEHEIDPENYSHRTMAVFEECDIPDRGFDTMSESGSAYWIEGDTLVRQSDHWGRVGTCYWSHPKPLGLRVGRCPFKRFLFDDGVFVPIPNDVLSASGSKAGKEWKSFAAKHDGAIMLKDQEWSPMIDWWESLITHPKANDILFRSDGHNEFTVKWTCKVTGLNRRCRFDRMIPGLLLGDVKTCRSVDPEQFAKDALNHGYHRQVAFYQDGGEALSGEILPMAFLAVEKEAPYRCEVIELSELFVEMGRYEINRALKHYAHCRQTGVWRSRTYGKVVTVDPPGWAIAAYQRLTN